MDSSPKTYLWSTKFCWSGNWYCSQSVLEPKKELASLEFQMQELPSINCLTGFGFGFGFGSSHGKISIFQLIEISILLYAPQPGTVPSRLTYGHSLIATAAPRGIYSRVFYSITNHTAPKRPPMEITVFYFMLARWRVEVREKVCEKSTC